MNKLSDIAITLIKFIESNRYVCPQPLVWQAMWDLLPNKTIDSELIKAPAPLILAGWNFSKDSQKKERLLEHIYWADSINSIEVIDQYLRSLDDNNWYKG